MSRVRRPFRLTLAAVAVALGVAGLVSVAAASSSGRTFVTAKCSGKAYKPAKIIFACGDNGFFATGLNWSQWGKRSATGSGTGNINTCKPDCASGKFKTGQVDITLSKPVVCSQDGKRHFTKAVYSWQKNAPVGPDRGRTRFPCSLIGS
jgi:hypothetical protein